MDEQGIDIEALSINPNFWDKAERDLAAQIVKLQNEKLAEICAKTPDRFVGLASVALAHPDLAAEQLAGCGQAARHARRAGRRQRQRHGAFRPGIAPVLGQGGGARLLVFIHPQGTPELEKSGRLKGSGGLINTIGNPLETTIALSHLIFEGTLDRFPRPEDLWRPCRRISAVLFRPMDAMCANRPDQCPVKLKKKPSEYLKQLYFDSMVFTPEGLRHLIAEVGAGQIVIGTDTRFRGPRPGRSHPGDAGTERCRPHRDARRDRREAAGITT
jgi:aminocarboxymuconate-semialdehyde decarboxylase